jgi:hypothetical protein
MHGRRLGLHISRNAAQVPKLIAGGLITGKLSIDC